MTTETMTDLLRTALLNAECVAALRAAGSADLRHPASDPTGLGQARECVFTFSTAAAADQFIRALQATAPAPAQAAPAPIAGAMFSPVPRT